MNTMHVIYRLFICSIFLPLFIATNEEFYQLLGITKSATQRDIRRAFKRIALEKHPDKRAVNRNECLFFLLNLICLGRSECTCRVFTN
jgi:DnaJ family protein C protein 10